jgi:hypothetical protein
MENEDAVYKEAEKALQKRPSQKGQILVAQLCNTGQAPHILNVSSNDGQ